LICPRYGCIVLIDPPIFDPPFDLVRIWSLLNTVIDYSVVPSVTGVSPVTGPAAGGTSVTISGTGFTAATGVSFGPTAATAMTVDSDIQITATSPAGTGTVDITVSTLAGTSQTSSADQFAYAAA
jgi:large repetitive protein